jgi:hypothetical protein
MKPLYWEKKGTNGHSFLKKSYCCYVRLAVFRIRFRNFFDPGIRLGSHPNPGSSINIPDHISKSLVTLICVKNTFKFFVEIENPGSCTGMEKFGSWIIIPDPQHYLLNLFLTFYASLRFVMGW